MPQRPVTPPTRRPLAGYTLIEILVVVAILGVIVGLATLSLGDGGRAAAWRDEATRLRDVLALAAADALALGRVHGLRVDADGYRPEVWRDGRWERPDRDPLHAPRRLPPELRLELSVGGEDVDLGRDSSGPQVQFQPGGDATAFELRLVAAQAPRWRITGSMTGALAVAAAADPP